jgi:uncharacterized SAM-binding protein YcdF (DUF218 family)
MIFLLQIKTLLRNQILPPSGPLLLAIVGILLLKRRPRLARACLMLAIGSLWLLATPMVADGLTALAEQYPPIDLQHARGAQAIVIIGGGGQRAMAPEYGGPAAGPVLLERLGYGAWLARETNLPVLVSGNGIEAEAMRATLHRNFKIEAHWVDDQAYDTFENAGDAARLLAPDHIAQIILVTQATHMRRAVREFAAAGFAVVAAPVGMLATREVGISRYLPDPGALQRAHAALYELLGEPVREALAATHLRAH